MRRKERDDTEEWRLALVNTRRIAKSQTPIEKLDELDSEDEEESEEDPLLIETANILLDYADLSSKLTAQQ